jgi:hypothetical protein
MYVRKNKKEPRPGAKPKLALVQNRFIVFLFSTDTSIYESA